MSDSKAHEPSGTIDELRALNLDTKSYRSCSPFKEGENAGCAFFHTCDREYKGVHGPHNHGILYIAASGATVQDVRSCFQYNALAPEHRQSGEVYEIVADEGEEILIKGTREAPVNPGNPNGRKKAQPFQRFEVVPAFPRPAEVFHDKVYEMKVRENLRRRDAQRRLEAAIGHRTAAESVMRGESPDPMTPGGEGA